MFVAAWKLEMCAAERMGAGKYEEALECYRKMMDRVELSAYHWERVARCYEWVGEGERAERAARCALDSDENSFDALRLLARLSIAQGHYAQAREYVRRALGVRRKSVAPRPTLLGRLLAAVDKVRKRGSAAEDGGAMTAGPEGDHEQWNAWAVEFLNGYERAFGAAPHARLP